MWQTLIQKAKEGGLNAIETYVFWNAHEPQRRQVFYFSSSSYIYIYIYIYIYKLF